MSVKQAACVALAVLVLLSTTAAAEPEPAAPAPEGFVQWVDPVVLCFPGLAQCIDLAPGYYLSVPTFDILDAEMKRLQDQETKLTAENKSLRKSADEFPWLPVAIGVGAGLVLGTYVGLKF